MSVVVCGNVPGRGDRVGVWSKVGGEKEKPWKRVIRGDVSGSGFSLIPQRNSGVTTQM